MRSLHGHDSWLHNGKPRSISSIEAFFDGFLKLFQACWQLNIQDGAFIERQADLGKDDLATTLDIDISDYLCIEEGKWEIHGHRFDKDPIYDIDDDYITWNLAFSHDLGDVVESHVDPFLNPSNTITNNNELFPPSEDGLEEKEFIKCSTSS